MRLMTLISVAAMGLAALGQPARAEAPSPTQKVYLEQGVARWGADFRRFAVASGKPEACAAACNADGACRAWTFVKPGIEGPQAQCRLKSAVPFAANDPCCVSGISAGASIGLLAGYEGVESTAAPPTEVAQAEAPARSLFRRPGAKRASAEGEGITASIRPRARAPAKAPPMQLMPEGWER